MLIIHGLLDADKKIPPAHKAGAEYSSGRMEPRIRLHLCDRLMLFFPGFYLLRAFTNSLHIIIGDVPHTKRRVDRK